ncbi:MAG: Hsp20 family protein [Candidatus Nanopelagicaceae bacterium]
MFKRLENMTHHDKNYPPYNLIKNDTSNYEIQIALAGFKSEEIEVSTESNILRIATTHEKPDSEVEYIHRGISKRSFTRTWQLGDDVRVTDVDFADGLLRVSLEKIIPEHQKRTVYTIGGSATTDRQLLTE